MTNQPTSAAPDLSEVPDTRPWIRRHWLLVGVVAGVLLIGGCAALASGDEPPEPEAAPVEMVTVTETVTAEPEPAPAETVTTTETVTAEPEPAETVTMTAEHVPAETVTVTAEPEPAETVTGSAEPDPEPEPEPDPDPKSLTRSQDNAVGKAGDYLDFASFSRSGLIEQLEYEGFSNGDASFAVDALDVDWNRQAALKAEDYLELSSFSRSGLIEQLEFEGFTPKQARYGVDQAGL